jgi:anti-sigma-K factor RskA
MSEDPALPDVAAAELALGLLDGEERAAALRRVLAEPAFAAEVERWRAYLAPLFDLWPEAAPPDDLWARIERSLDGVSTPVGSNRSWPWRALAGLMTAAAAVLLVLLLVRPGITPVPSPQPAVVALPEQMLVAAITPSAKGKSVTAVYDARAGSLRLSAGEPAPRRRATELWVIASDGVPHSLGLLRSGSSTALRVADADRARLFAGATLAISIEPEGGSKTGLPTGPVVAMGTLSDA